MERGRECAVIAVHWHSAQGRAWTLDLVALHAHRMGAAWEVGSPTARLQAGCLPRGLSRLEPAGDRPEPAQRPGGHSISVPVTQRGPVWSRGRAVAIKASKSSHSRSRLLYSPLLASRGKWIFPRRDDTAFLWFLRNHTRRLATPRFAHPPHPTPHQPTLSPLVAPATRRL